MSGPEQKRRTNWGVMLYRWHAWLGLHVLAVLFLLFLSGSLLVFLSEIEAFFDPKMQRDVSVPLEETSFATSFDGLLAARAGHRIDYLETMSPSGWVAHTGGLTDPEGHGYQAWVDQGTGAFLGTGGSLYRDVFRTFHDSFLTTKRLGGILTASFGLPLLLMTVSGMFAYRRFWQGFFRLPPRNKGARAFWGGLHRLVAVWCLPFLLVAGITASYFFAGTLGLMGSLPIPDYEVTDRAELGWGRSRHCLPGLGHGTDGVAFGVAMFVGVSAPEVDDSCRVAGRKASGKEVPGYSPVSFASVADFWIELVVDRDRVFRCHVAQRKISWSVIRLILVRDLNLLGSSILGHV